MFIQQLTFSIAAGETKRFEFTGAYIEVIDAAYALSVTIYDPVSGAQSTAANIESGFYAQVPYNGVEVKSAAAQTLTILFTDGSGGSRRMPGNVNVIDNSAAKSIGGTVFAGSYTASAIAGAGSVVMMDANAGGGKNVAVRALLLQSATAGPVFIYTATGPGTLGAPNAALRSMYVNIGGNSASARVKAAFCAAASPTAAEVGGLATWVKVYLPANTPQLVPMAAPIVLNGANMIVISAEALNRDISALIEVEEL